MITRIIVRVKNKPHSEMFISSDKKGRELILRIERESVPDCFDFCKPLVKSANGFTRGAIEYIIDRRERFIVIV